MRSRASPPPGGADELGRCGGEHGAGERRVVPALTSHGRGHRFETCHAHQHKRPSRIPRWRRLPADCQQTTNSGRSSAESVAPFRDLAGLPCLLKRGPGRLSGQVGFEPASTLLGRPRSWAGRCCGLRFLRTRRDRWCPPVSAGSRCGTDPVRTGPTLTEHTRATGRLVLASGKEDSAWGGHRRGRRPCSAGSEESLPGFGARVIGLSSTSSMTSVRPAGIGPCMSPGRMGICRSDGWGSTSFVWRGVASCPRELEIGSPVRRVMAARRPGLEPGPSSLSGFCPRACYRRIAPATCANDLPLETAGDRCEPLGSDGMWTKRGPSRTLADVQAACHRRLERLGLAAR